MKVKSKEFDDAIEAAECLLDELTNNAADDIDIFENSRGEETSLSEEDFMEKLRDKRDSFRDVLVLTKNLCPLVRECAVLAAKHPREGREISAVLKRMGFSIEKTP